MLSDILKSKPLVLPTITVPSKDQLELFDILDQGQALHEKFDYSAAEKIYKEVLKRSPDHPRATALTGLIAYARGDIDRALEILDRAANLDPNDTLILSNYCAVLYAEGRMLDSCDVGIQAIAAWPGYAMVYANLSAPLSDTYRQAEAKYLLKRSIEIEPESEKNIGLLVFTSDLCDDTTPEEALEIRQIYNERFVKKYAQESYRYDIDRSEDKVIRVGYVSSDFYSHSAMTTFSSLFINFDDTKFEVYSYGSVDNEDEITEGFKKSSTVYRDINGMSDEEIAALVREDKIDILVDLSGFTKGTHLGVFARRPAPIQASGWGYATGMSMDCFDWFFADSVTVPPGDERFFTEGIVRLPCTLSWLPPRMVFDISPVPSYLGHPFTFGSFSRQHKLTPTIIDAWAEILNRVPDSRLVIKNTTNDCEQVRQCTLKMFSDRGITTDTYGNQRIYPIGKLSHPDSLTAHWPIDVMLDPFPHGNGVSTFESLWMGIPIVTLYGDRVSGRITASILKQIGLDDWVADSPAAYVERAVRSAEEIPSLLHLRHSLRQKLEASQMMDLPGYTKHVEDAYRKVWKLWTQKTPAPSTSPMPLSTISPDDSGQPRSSTDDISTVIPTTEEQPDSLNSSPSKNGSESPIVKAYSSLASSKLRLSMGSDGSPKRALHTKA